MITVDIEERLAELDTAVAELKAVATEGESGSDASLSLTERQRDLEGEQSRLRAALRRVGDRS